MPLWDVNIRWIDEDLAIISALTCGQRIIWQGRKDEMPEQIRAIIDGLFASDPKTVSWARIKADFARARAG